MKIRKEPMLEDDIKCYYEIKIIDGKKYAQIGCCDGADKNCPHFFNNGNCGEYCKYEKKLIQIQEA